MQKKTAPTILIIDQDEQELCLIQYCLSQIHGANLNICNSYTKGLNETKKINPDLVLIELSDRSQALELKNEIQTKFPNIAIVFISENETIEEINTLKKRGVQEVFLKPLDPLTFSSRLQAVLNSI